MPNLKTRESHEWPSHAKTFYNDIARAAPLAFDITWMKIFLITVSQENSTEYNKHDVQLTCATHPWGPSAEVQTQCDMT